MSRVKFILLSLGVLTCCTSKPPPPPHSSQTPAKKDAPTVEQNCTNPKLREGQTLTVSLNIKNGQFIQLSDNSVWKINPADVSVTSAWLTPANIDISKSLKPDYPCLLTNRQTYSSVSARRLASIDEAK